MGNSALEAKFRWNPEARDFGVGVLEPDIIETIRNSPEQRGRLEREFRQIKEDREALRAWTAKLNPGEVPYRVIIISVSFFFFSMFPVPSWPYGKHSSKH